jgi:hypothetical protein
MCGIVGVAGTGPCSHQMKEFFTTLLFHDVVRGHHATGVAAIDTINRSLVVEKKAIASPEFLQEKEVMENLFAPRHNFNIYIGHNRWATSGAKDDDDNAHPFIHGDIVGVHNGSLRKQSRLDDHKDFVVDSDNLFYQLNKTGLDDTISKADGAYALVWYDRKDNTLNFIRNEERPLAIARLSNGYWIWASEIGMLRWLVKRHKTLSFASNTEEKEGGKIKYDTIFNLEKGVHMKIAFKDKTRQYDGDPEFIKKVLPTFPYETVYTGKYYGGGSRRGWQDSRGDTTSTTTRFATTCQEMLDKFMVGGKVSDSVLEVEYQKVLREKTRTGFEATIALFHFNNKDGQVVKCHAFVHNGTPFLKDWEGDDSKKGTRVYGTICTITAADMATYECTRNEEPLNFSLSLNMLRLEPPKRYFAFGETPGPKASDADKIKAIIEKGGVDTNKNVVPFRERTLRPAHEEATKEVAEKGGKTPEVEGLDKESFMSRKILLANGECTQKKYLEIFSENGPMCSNCGNNISSMSTSRLWRTIYYDRDMAVYQNYLSCSKRCYSLTEDVMKQLDEDYDKRFGGRDD